jgi:phosphoribosylamine---glycine ligase
LSRKVNVLLIGSGGREHAIAWKIRQSTRCGALFCAPGNPGIAGVAECVPIAPGESEKLLAFAREKKIDLTIVGPEQPLAAGIVDLFVMHGLKIFGPTRMAARLEWSKAFAKEFMQRHGIPTAAYRTFTHSDRVDAAEYLKSCTYPVVLKADGLAAGKGVVICSTSAEAFDALHEMMDDKLFGASNDTVVVEEFMQGEEASIFAICDGRDFITLASAQDHKRVFDDDRGKNTGGMGAYAPAPVVTGEILDRVVRTIIVPTLEGIAKEGSPYKGCLYVGLMIANGTPRVVEFNSRFGDPETQVVLPLFQGDLLDVMEASVEGTIGACAPSSVSSSGSAVCVVLTSAGYPDEYSKGIPIEGLTRESIQKNALVFHAGTRKAGERIVTDGGRVLGATAVSSSGDLRITIEAAYKLVSTIHFEGMHYRRDIGKKALERQK